MPREVTLNRAGNYEKTDLLWIKVFKSTSNECIPRKVAELSGVQMRIHFFRSFIFKEFLHKLGKRTFRSIFEFFPFMFFCDCSVSNIGRSRNSVTSKPHNLLISYNTTQI